MITPLRCGVDTLEATFAGELSEEVVSELKRRKELAIASGKPNELMLGGRAFYLGPKGVGPWQYSMRNDEMMVWFSTAKHVPPMLVKLLQQGLAEVGVASLWNQAKEIASELGSGFQNCTRLDVALDYQGEFFTVEEMRNIVCPAHFRPVYPNIENPQTYQFGKGDIVLRVYDKSAEIMASRKEWWKFIWRQCGGCSADAPVYRVEAQIRGNVLRELGYHSVEHIIEELPEIFDYALRWASLRVPVADTNRSRWPEDPRWTKLRTAFAPSRELGRIRPAKALVDYDRAVKRFASMVASLGASLESTDYWQLCKAITQDAEQYIERELDTTFEEYVERKRKQNYL